VIAAATSGSCIALVTKQNKAHKLHNDKARLDARAVVQTCKLECSSSHTNTRRIRLYSVTCIYTAAVLALASSCACAVQYSTDVMTITHYMNWHETQYTLYTATAAAATTPSAAPAASTMAAVLLVFATAVQ
jgi:hypothetical protein